MVTSLLLAAFLDLSPRHTSHFWRLVVPVFVSLLSAASFCCCRILVVVVSVLLSLVESSRCRCFVVVGSGFPPCGLFHRILRLFNVVVVGVLSSLLGILLLAASRCCHCRRLLVVVGGGGGILSLLLAAASRRSLKSLVYIRLAMHSTNMEPQHQVHNGPDALSGVWGLNIVWPSPQSKLTYPFVPKFQQVIGTNIELFERVLALFFSQHVPSLSNRCTFALANVLSGSFVPATELELNRFRPSPF